MDTKTDTPIMEYEAAIGTEVAVRLMVFGKIEKLTSSQRNRVFKLGDAVNAAGEGFSNGAPKERKTRMRKPATNAGTTDLPVGEA